MYEFFIQWHHVILTKYLTKLAKFCGYIAVRT